LGATPNRTGTADGGVPTKKGEALLIPPVVVAVTKRGPPAAAAETANVAEAVVSLFTTMFPTEIPGPGSIVIPGMNRAPVNTTLTAALLAL